MNMSLKNLNTNIAGPIDPVLLLGHDPQKENGKYPDQGVEVQCVTMEGTEKRNIIEVIFISTNNRFNFQKHYFFRSFTFIFTRPKAIC